MELIHNVGVAPIIPTHSAPFFRKQPTDYPLLAMAALPLDHDRLRLAQPSGTIMVQRFVWKGDSRLRLRQPQTIALYRLCVQSRFETAMSDNALNIFIQNIISGYQDMGVTAQAMAVQPDLRKRIKITDKAKEPAWTHDQSKRMEIL